MHRPTAAVIQQSSTTAGLTLQLFRVIGPEDNEVDSLAFETLIPKPILQRYVSLLTEHRRVILCGSSGTGKSYLAHKLAEHLLQWLVRLVVHTRT